MDNNEQKIGIEENCGKGIIGNTNQNAEGMQELTEEMSSTSINKNASEEIENKEQKSIKKRLRFGGWLPDCLDWFKRPELAQTSLPTSSYTFNQYCWPKLHGKVKPRVVRRLTFWRELDDEGNWQTILETDRHIRIPIDIKPLDYIIGYKWICICFIDDRVLQFVRHILPLLNEVKIYFRRVKFENNQQIGLLMELLAPKINKLELDELLDEPLITDLDELYPNFISGLQSICLQNAEPAGIDMDLALKWLTTPREDGKPKMLEIHFPNTSDDRNETIFIGKFMEKRIERFKKEFIRSTEPVNFIMLYTLTASFPILARQFKIENETTKEILELKLMKSKKDYFTKHFLIRCKNDGETTTNVDDLDKQFERKEETYFGIVL